MGKRLKSGNGGSREGSGGGDSVDSGYDEYDEDYRLVQLDFTLKLLSIFMMLERCCSENEDDSTKLLTKFPV